MPDPAQQPERGRVYADTSTRATPSPPICPVPLAPPSGGRAPRVLAEPDLCLLCLLRAIRWNEYTPAATWPRENVLLRFVAQDTGGAIGGRHVDVYRPPPADPADTGANLTRERVFIELAGTRRSD